MVGISTDKLSVENVPNYVNIIRKYHGFYTEKKVKKERRDLSLLARHHPWWLPDEDIFASVHYLLVSLKITPNTKVSNYVWCNTRPCSYIESGLCAGGACRFVILEQGRKRARFVTSEVIYHRVIFISTTPTGISHSHVLNSSDGRQIKPFSWWWRGFFCKFCHRQLLNQQTAIFSTFYIKWALPSTDCLSNKTSTQREIYEALQCQHQLYLPRYSTTSFPTSTQTSLVDLDRASWFRGAHGAIYAWWTIASISPPVQNSITRSTMTAASTRKIDHGSSSGRSSSPQGLRIKSGRSTSSIC